MKWLNSDPVKKTLAFLSLSVISLPVYLVKCTLKQTEGGIENSGNNSEKKTRAQDIISSNQWADYKNLWIELDTLVDYSHPDSGISAGHFTYIDMSELEQKLEKTSLALKELEEHGLLSSFENEMLLKMAESRMKYMSGWLYFTRMMPPPVDISSDHLIRFIDAKTDSLFRLKREGLISQEEANSAAEFIVLGLEKYAKLQAVHQIQNRWGWESPMMLSVMGENGYLDIIDMDVLEYLQKTYDRMESFHRDGTVSDSLFDYFSEIYEKTETDLLYLETIMPFMDTLFRDLLTRE
ncbi:hypothetical protein JW890_02500 [candidate division WOR-3 bacterium]|nr:hypothetical protein [candidate division WOR-3 bacterium]